MPASETTILDSNGFKDALLEHTNHGESPSSLIFAAILAGLTVLTCASFLPHQSLWNDEATQLDGLGLNPVRVVMWLTDKENYDFGVPDDRMPPLSYWSGWLWSKAFGLSETSLRWFGVACIASATALVYLASRRCWGERPALISALLMALSPNVISISVEIRAYPLLILTSAAVYYCLTRFLVDPEPRQTRWLIGITVCAIAAIYTHFFGLVVAGGVFLALLCLSWRDKQRVLPILVAIIVIGLFSIGLYPFVVASTSLSGEAKTSVPGTQKLADFGRLLYRVFSNPAISVSKIMIGLALLGGLLAIFACLGSFTRDKRSPVLTAYGILIVSGLAVIFLANLALTMFTAASINYNAWLFPATAILLPAGLCSVSASIRAISAVGLTMLLVASGFGAYQLAVNGESFAHLPFRPISQLIDREGPENVSIIFDGETDNPWMVYSPLRYQYGKALPQYTLVPGKNVATVQAYPDGKTEIPFDQIRTPSLIVIRSKAIRYDELAKQVNTGVKPLGDGPLVRDLTSRGERWTRVEEANHAAFVQADIDVFHRAKAPATQPSN